MEVFFLKGSLLGVTLRAGGSSEAFPGPSRHCRGLNAHKDYGPISLTQL